MLNGAPQPIKVTELTHDANLQYYQQAPDPLDKADYQLTALQQGQVMYISARCHLPNTTG